MNIELEDWLLCINQPPLPFGCFIPATGFPTKWLPDTLLRDNVSIEAQRDIVEFTGHVCAMRLKDKHERSFTCCGIFSPK